jgi:carbohydrate binding protein with CBM35 domain
MPDIYPNFPYRWVSWDDWLGKVRQQVGDRLASGATNIYAYEIWNEPDWTWDTAAAGAFDDGWVRTFRQIRDLDPATPIMGPSISLWDAAWMRRFLTNAKATGTLPQVVCWHELDPRFANDLYEHVQEYRQLERELGIGPLPISVNEYGSPRDMAVPGALTRFIARFERAGVDTANLAFWHKPGRLADLVVDNSRPNGGWWLYKSYGDMAGSMVQTTAPSNSGRGLEGFASADPATRTVRAVVGGAAGDALLRFRGLRTSAVHAAVWSTTWTGTDGASAAPIERFEGDYTVRSGAVTVPVSDLAPDDAYYVVLTPKGAPTARQAQHRYEAEAAKLHAGRVATAEQASNGRYARLERHARATFTVTAPASGPYTLSVRYADRAGNGAQQLDVNGGPPVKVAAYDATPAGEFATWETTVNLARGRNTLRLTTVSGTPSLDYLDLQPFRARVEAESGTITDGRVIFEDPAGFFANHYSGEHYVAFLVNPDSAVELNVTAPVAGPYDLVVGYSNGTGAVSRHALAINGTAAGTVTYPPTQFWGLIGTTTVPVTLRAGTNTIRLSNAGGIADLDFVDVAVEVAP